MNSIFEYTFTNLSLATRDKLLLSISRIFEFNPHKTSNN